MSAAITSHGRARAALRHTLLRGTALALCAAISSPAAGQTLPVVSNAGGATITNPTADSLQVDINGANRVVTYDSFKLGTSNSATEALIFKNSGVAGQFTAVNRVTGGGGSEIWGSITAQDSVNVWLIDPAGITFGTTGTFSGNSLVLSTLDFKNANFNAPQFAGTSDKSVTLSPGSMLTANNGSLFALAQQIDASGALRAYNGAIALVATQDISFTDIVGSPLAFTINKGTELSGALVSASGTLDAQRIALAGGTELAMTAALLNVQPGARLTATAAGDSIILATDDQGTIVTNASQTAAIAASGRLVTTDASGNIVVNSNDTATVDADVTAPGYYYVTGAKGVVLGKDNMTVTQRAGGEVKITATTGDVLGKGALTLQSNSDGVLTEPLTLKAADAAGKVDFNAATTLLGGKALESAVVVTGGAGIALGDVTAKSLGSDGTTLTSAGAISLGNVNVADGLAIKSTGDSVTAVSLTAAGDIAVQANTNFQATKAVSNGGALALTATTGDIALATGTAATSATLNAGGKATGGSVSAGNNTSVTAGGAITFASLAATAGSVTATGGSVDVGTVSAGTAATLKSSAGNVRLGNGQAGTNVVVDSKALATVEGDVAAGGNYSVTGATGVVLGDGATRTQSAAGSVTVTAAANDVIGKANLTLQSNSDGAGAEDLTLTAARAVDFQTASLLRGGTASQSRVLVMGPTAITLYDVKAKSLSTDGVTLTSNGPIALHDVTVTDSLAIKSANSSIMGGTLTSGGALSLTATNGDIALTTGTAATDATLNAGGKATGGSVSAGNNTSVTAGGAITFASLAATAGSVTATGGSVDVGTVSAGTEATLKSSAGNVRLGNGQAGTNVVVDSKALATVEGDVAAGGNYSVTGATGVVLGDGATRTQSAAGSVTVTAAANDVIGKANLALQSNSDGAGAEPLTITAAGLVNFSTATISGGIAGARSNVTIDGGTSVALNTVTGANVTLKAGGALTGASATAETGNVTAIAGSIDFGGFAAMNDVSATAGVVTLDSAIAGNGVMITASNGDARLGTGSAGITDVVVAAADIATVDGDIVAKRDYIVTGQNGVVLGTSGTPVSQKAERNVMVAATTTGDVVGRDGLTLQSEATGASAGPLTISAAGAVSFATETNITGGIFHARADVTIDGGTSVGLGTVTGANVALTAGGALTGESASAETGNLTASAGSIDFGGFAAADNVTATAGNIKLVSATATKMALTAKATAGDLTLGAGRAGTNATLTATGSADVDDAAAGSNILIDAAAGNARLGAGTAGTDIAITAGQSATVDRDISAGNDYVVTGGTGVVLGDGQARTHSAGNAVTITATTGNIVGSDKLTLQSNKAGANAAGALQLDAANGSISFASAAVDESKDSTVVAGLATGDANNRSDLLVRTGSSGSLTLGTVTARKMRSIRDPASVRLAGPATLGATTLDEALDLATANGAIRTTSITINDPGASLRLSAGGASSDLTTTGVLKVNAADILLTAGQDIDLARASFFIDEEGNPTANTVGMLAGKNAVVANVEAAEDVAIQTGQDLSFSAITAGDDIDIVAGGSVTGGSLTSTGQGADNSAVRFAEPAGDPAAIKVAGAAPDGHNISVSAGRNVGSAPGLPRDPGLILASFRAGSLTATADTGDIRIGLATARTDDIHSMAAGSVSGLNDQGTPTDGLAISAPGSVNMNVAGTVELTSLTAAQVTITAGSLLRVTDGNVTGSATLETTSGGSGPFRNVPAPVVPGYGAADLKAARNIMVTANGAGQFGTLDAGQDIDVSASALTVGTANAGGGSLSLLARAGLLALGTGTAATTATLVKRDDDGDGLAIASDVLTADTVTGGTGVEIRSATDAIVTSQAKATANDLFASATRDVLTEAGTAGRTTAIVAGRDLFATTLSAGEDVAAAAGRDASFGTVAAGDNVTLRAETGALMLNSATTAGGGGDDLAYLLATSKAGTADAIMASGVLVNGDVSLNAKTNVTATTAVTAVGTLAIRAGGNASSTDKLSAAEDVSINAGGAAAFNTIAAGDDIDVAAAGAVSLPSALAGSNIRIVSASMAVGDAIASKGALVFTAETGDLALSNGFAGTDATLSALGGSATGGIVRAGGGNITVNAGPLLSFSELIASGSVSGSAGTVLVGGATAGSSIGLNAGAGRLDLGTGSAGTTIELLKRGASDVLNAGTLSAGTGITIRSETGALVQSATTTKGDLTVNAANDASLGSGAAAAGSLAILAGGSATSGTKLSAFEDVAVRTGGAASLAMIAAGDDIDVLGGDTVSIAAASADKSGGDTRFANLSLASAGQASGIQFAAGDPELSGSNIRVKAAAISLGEATASKGALTLTALNGSLAITKGTAGTNATLIAAGSGQRLTIGGGGLNASGQILLDSAGDIAIGGMVSAGGANPNLTLRNSGAGATVIGEGAGSGSFNLADAEMDNLSAANIVVDSGAQDVTFGQLSVAPGTGTSSLRFLGTGTVELKGAITMGGASSSSAPSRTLQIGGGAGPAAVVTGTTPLAALIQADVSAASLKLDDGIVDLRAKRIVFGSGGSIARYVKASPDLVSTDISRPSSNIYQPSGPTTFLSAGRLLVSYSDFALFQKTLPAGGGADINRSGLSTDPSLQLFSTGDNVSNSFAMFGTVNGLVSSAAAVPPVFFDDVGGRRTNRVTQVNSRVNGCVIGAPDKGCLNTDPPRPNFSVYDQRQTQLFGRAEDASLFFNPLIGRGNEGLIVDIADAPVGIDTIDCPPDDASCKNPGDEK
ncbi:filamentous hemagglutinin N-terminal domain-containing protein [Sphingomonas sp. MAH-20]|uniref:Filamentous hemagglutinin N-terminal domain-containing protein n=1 Tax=Sphingomonas horti TaxID=2682842 RepID=A0A6I4IZG9_9SPHN|nr:MULTISPECIES: filamentous hemagglutinin N-terminal domain-containing protein [Sphingomonas]MBA2920559.1 filamentous hemagglutinin N-terminal domain-containing protein [Sphingomonas sp. CGMCC 1.13658]MVO76811.1 filamentous hemagglutinin N-terminal domain-containing protein [Sphingomonas horti]